MSSLVAKAVEQAAADLVRSGAFDEAIFKIVADTVRRGRDAGLSETGFVMKMAVEIMDLSRPTIPFRAARRMAGAAYSEFLRENKIQFGEPGWDWSGASARLVVHEYETDHWDART